MLAAITAKPEYFSDKSIIIYGESNSGKTTIIKDILFSLRESIEQIIVFCPTDFSHKTYSSGLVEKSFIHTEVSERILELIWERQEFLVKCWRTSNDKEILSGLASRIIGNTYDTFLEDLRKKMDALCDEFDDGDGKAKDKQKQMDEMTAKYDQLVVAFYKNIVIRNKSELSKMQLKPCEKICLEYISLNPKIVLIFDDCTEQFKKLKGKQILEKLFYQGRHMHITSIYTCHSDKALDQEIKKNSFVNFFCDSSSAQTYFGRSSGYFSPSQVAQAQMAINTAFKVKFQKLLWLKESSTFYRFTAVIHDSFTFGSELVREFGKLVSNEEAHVIDSGNRFAQKYGMT